MFCNEIISIKKQFVFLSCSFMYILLKSNSNFGWSKNRGRSSTYLNCPEAFKTVFNGADHELNVVSCCCKMTCKKLVRLLFLLWVWALNLKHQIRKAIAPKVNDEIVIAFGAWPPVWCPMNIGESNIFVYILLCVYLEVTVYICVKLKQIIIKSCMIIIVCERTLKSTIVSHNWILN